MEMCEPTTLLILGTAMSAGGSILGGIGAYQTGKANARILNSNADQAIQNGLQGRNIAAVNANVPVKQAREAVGTTRALAAKRGVEVDQDSTLDIQAHNAEVGAFERLKVLFKADTENDAYIAQAGNFRAQAAASKAAGRNALYASLFKAAGTAATGAYKGHQAGLWKPPGTAGSSLLASQAVAPPQALTPSQALTPPGGPGPGLGGLY